MSSESKTFRATQSIGTGRDPSPREASLSFPRLAGSNLWETFPSIFKPHKYYILRANPSMPLSKHLPSSWHPGPREGTSNIDSPSKVPQYSVDLQWCRDISSTTETGPQTTVLPPRSSSTTPQNGTGLFLFPGRLTRKPLVLHCFSACLDRYRVRTSGPLRV
ncbi:hypothetical protein BCR34DRAFT_309344 [Clohesyomyces aquaticus]|uniref:Uncharacterized protein n=1 Tax=Clohesyomyces aquaticus TaxID=1231657 RepID=A0A1Y1ZQ72_9PLEO|nr:hypothetical protein BCR34DRAFT_309344 [Clohesyomyces aquaticus]